MFVAGEIKLVLILSSVAGGGASFFILLAMGAGAALGMASGWNTGRG